MLSAESVSDSPLFRLCTCHTLLLRLESLFGHMNGELYIQGDLYVRGVDLLFGHLNGGSYIPNLLMSRLNTSLGPDCMDKRHPKRGWYSVSS